MRCQVPPFRLRRAVLCLNTALAALAACGAARAQSEPDPRLYELTHLRSRVEIGAEVRDRRSAKAEEYSGVDGQRANAVAAFELAGGDAYDSAGTYGWRVLGDRLGLRSRSVEAEAGAQGRWRLKLGYDELQRNGSDSYQTPYQGVGTNRLTLPADWQAVVVPRVNATTPNARGLSPEVTASPVLVAGVPTAPTPAQAAAAAALQAADLPAFNRVDLFTRRTRESVGLALELDSRWSASGQLVHEHKQGLKALGAQSRATEGDTSSILPVPIDEDDHRLSLGLEWVGDEAQFQAGFEASTFRNHVPSVTWNLWAAPALFATMATPPGNTWRKLSLSGNVLLAPGTRLTAAASHARSAQNEAFLSDPTAPLVPVASAQAEVRHDNVSLRLQHEANREWRFGASYRYALRDNRTPVNLYGFYDNDNAPTGTSPFAALFPGLTGLGQNFNLNANTPYSRRDHQAELEADWRFASAQHLKLALSGSRTDRWCRGSWINCADAPDSRETQLRAEWTGTLRPDLSGRVALSGAQRDVDYDENAFLAVVPMAGQSPSTATGALAGSTALQALQTLGLTGWGPASGLNPAAPAGSLQAFYFPNNNVLNNLLYGNENRISELPGLRRYNQADRRRQSFKSGLQWRASEAFTLQGGLDLNEDHYPHSVYGLQRSGGKAFNLDASFHGDEDQSLSVFATHERQRARVAGNTYTANSAATAVNGATALEGGCFATLAERNAHNKIDPCLDWQSDQRDVTTTLGLQFTLAPMAGGTLVVDGGMAWAQARTDVRMRGGNYVNNPLAGVAGAATGSIAAFYVPATDLPTSSVESWQFQLGGTWRFAPGSALRVQGGWQRLRSSDWATLALQDGGLTQVLPTREEAPRYSVHSLAVSYVLEF